MSYNTLINPHWASKSEQNTEKTARITFAFRSDKW